LRPLPARKQAGEPRIMASWNPLTSSTTRLPVFVCFLTVPFVLLYLAFSGFFMPAAASLVLASVLFLVIALVVDTVLYPVSLLQLSPSTRLALVRNLDRDLDTAIERAESYVANLGGENKAKEANEIAQEFHADFVGRPPALRLAQVLLHRTIANFGGTILAFTFASMALLLLESPSSTYGHSCQTVGGFWGVLLHLLYYHLVIFQSLGDGTHAPQSLAAQSIAIAETIASFTYVLLTFGRVLSVPVAALNELSADRLVQDLKDRLSMGITIKAKNV
jgi:hypothetical protein